MFCLSLFSKSAGLHLARDRATASVFNGFGGTSSISDAYLLPLFHATLLAPDVPTFDADVRSATESLADPFRGTRNIWKRISASPPRLRVLLIDQIVERALFQIVIKTPAAD
jgi:hypothetical protein